MKKLTTILMCLATLGCADDDDKSAQPDMASDNAVTPMVFFQTADGEPAGADTPDDMVVDRVYPGGVAELYGSDGERMTWGEVTGASGRAEVTCTSSGTRVRIEAAGLEPDGVYTGWLAFFGAPGFVEGGLDTLEAISPMGPPDGSMSEGVADADGHLGFDSMVIPGNATMSFIDTDVEIPTCLPDAYEVHLVLAYHQDGRTCGDNPCEFPTFAEHVAWMIFEGEML